MLLRSSARRKAEHSALLNLPFELVTHIIRFLPLKDRKTFSRVCRRFCALARSPQAGLVRMTFGEIDVGEGGGAEVDQLFRSTGWHAAIGTVVLDIDWMNGALTEHEEVLRATFRQIALLPNLERIHVIWNEYSGTEFWAPLVASLVEDVGSKLRAVKLEFEDGNYETRSQTMWRLVGTVWEKCTRMEDFTVDTTTVLDIQYPPLAPHSTLKRLEYRSKNGRMLGRFLATSPNLERIKIKSSITGSLDLAQLQVCPNLTHVEVSTLTEVDLQKRMVFPMLPKLEVVVVDMPCPFYVEMLGTCPRLRRVSLACTELPSGMPDFQTQRLESFALSSRPELFSLPSLKTLSFLSAQTQTLKSLSLYFVGKIGLDALTPFKALTSIKLVGCVLEHTHGNELVLDHFPHLSVLHLQYMTNLACIKATSYHKRLRRLVLVGATLPYDPAYGFLAFCTALDYLLIEDGFETDMNLIRPPASLVCLVLINVDGTTLFPINNPALQRITIYDCTSLRSLGSVPAAAGALTKVSLQNCKELRDISVLTHIPTIQSLTLVHVDRIRTLKGFAGHENLCKVSILSPKVNISALASCPKVGLDSVTVLDDSEGDYDFSVEMEEKQERLVADLQRAITRRLASES